MATRGGKAKRPQAPKPRKTQTRRRAAEDDEVTVADSSKAPASRIIWGPTRTERLVEWLENNVEDRQRLFSDSAQDAREDNRRRRTAKNVKMTFYIKIAEYVFSADEDAKVRDELRTHGLKRYGKSVENRISM
jgi:hypothetical protein